MCVYISTLEASADSKLNSLHLDFQHSVLPLGTEFLCHEILGSVPEKEQNIPRYVLGEKGRGAAGKEGKVQNCISH